jgi:hypothetical protein
MMLTYTAVYNGYAFSYSISEEMLRLNPELESSVIDTLRIRVARSMKVNWADLVLLKQDGSCLYFELKQ